MKKRENIAGQRFNRLVALSPAEDRILKNGRHLTMWNCRCDCGNTITVRTSDLKSGAMVSCGCYRAENTGRVHTTHGGTKNGKTEHLYSVWAGMHSRCNCEKNTAYKYYGRKGVTVCDEWNKYETFKEWALSNGYKQGLTIDRIDVNGNYCPDNCRWVTYIEQANNKTDSRMVHAFGETRTVAEWAKRNGLKYATLLGRLNNGWDAEKAISTPVKAVV